MATAEARVAVTAQLHPQARGALPGAEAGADTGPVSVAAPSMLRTALAHIERGRYRDAEQTCLQILLDDAEHAGATTVLAISLQAQQRFDEAIALFQRLAAVPGAGVAQANNLGNCLREAGRHAAAAEALQRALALGGEQPGILLNLGLNALDQADPDAAMHWLDRALQLQPEDEEIRTYAAAAAFDAGETGKARELLQPALHWTRGEAGLLAEAAWLLFRLDAVTEAGTLLDRALQADPAQPRVLLRAAAIHERCNRLEAAAQLAAQLEAQGALERGLAEDLDLLRAALAGRGNDAAAARQLHQQLADAGGNNTQNPSLYFSLARLCDREGDAAAAMQALEKAHALKVARLRPRSPQLFAAATPFTITRYRLDAAQYAAWIPDENAPSMQDSPVFIVGFPRSGTTLLETVLDAHPGLACMDERAYLQDLIEQIQSWGLRYPEDLGRLSPAQCASLRATYRDRVARHVDWSGGVRLVDKNPLNLLKLPLLRRLYPQAPILLALRHPADVVLSNYLQNFGSPVFVALCATLQSTARGYVEAMDFWCDQHAILGGYVLESRYEDLVGDLPQQARKILDFLQLPWHDAVLAPHTHAAARGFISTPSYAQVAEPVNSRAVQRWRMYRKWFEPVREALGPWVERWGYGW